MTKTPFTKLETKWHKSQDSHIYCEANGNKTKSMQKNKPLIDTMMENRIFSSFWSFVIQISDCVCGTLLLHYVLGLCCKQPCDVQHEPSDTPIIPKTAKPSTASRPQQTLTRFPSAINPQGYGFNSLSHRNIIKENYSCNKWVGGKKLNWTV